MVLAFFNASALIASMIKYSYLYLLKKKKSIVIYRLSTFIYFLILVSMKYLLADCLHQ